MLFYPFLVFITAECTPEEAFSIVGDNIIFASGSPFRDVDLGMCLGYLVKHCPHSNSLPIFSHVGSGLKLFYYQSKLSL